MERMAAQLSADPHPMNFSSALRAIRDVLANKRDLYLVNEGANTLDFARNIIDMYEPRKRLDVGTWGVMGIGMGYAIAAATVSGKPVVAIEGDSAFGFNGMEIETICRYKLPVVIWCSTMAGFIMAIHRRVSALSDRLYSERPIRQVDRSVRRGWLQCRGHFEPCEVARSCTGGGTPRVDQLCHRSDRRYGERTYNEPEPETYRREIAQFQQDLADRRQPPPKQWRRQPSAKPLESGMTLYQSIHIGRYSLCRMPVVCVIPQRSFKRHEGH